MRYARGCSTRPAAHGGSEAAGLTWEHGWAAVDGGRVAYTLAGGRGTPGGPVPLLLLHGWAASRRLWEPMMALVAGERTCIAVDMPGFGESPGVVGAEAPGDLGRLVVQAARGLGLGPVAIVGHSLGAIVALEMALGAPDLVRGLVLVGPPEREAVRRRSRLLTRNVTGWPLALAMAATARLAVHLAPESGWGRPGAWLRRRAAGCGTSPAMLLASIRRLGEAAVYDRLEDVPVPVRIVVGARDVSTPPDQAAALARRIPRAEVIVVGEAGHHVMTDAPGTLGRLIAEALGQ